MMIIARSDIDFNHFQTMFRIKKGTKINVEIPKITNYFFEGFEKVISSSKDDIKMSSWIVSAVTIVLNIVISTVVSYLWQFLVDISNLTILSLISVSIYGESKRIFKYVLQLS